MNLIVGIVLLAASYLFQAVTAKHPKVTPATLQDFQMPQTAEGTPQAWIFGDVWITDYAVLWYGALQSVGIPQRASKTGKSR